MRYINSLSCPCTYQGAKQRVSKQIVDYIVSTTKVTRFTKIYDLCCGSGAITLEFLNRGISPEQVVMCDCCSWGKFYDLIGRGCFDIETFYKYSKDVPRDKSLIQDYIKSLSKGSVDDDEAYVYLLLQAASFGGRQIYVKDNKWCNTSFRDYWQPTETSKRRSPVNPMQPMIDVLEERVEKISIHCKGLKCYNTDIFDMLPIIEKDTGYKIVYIDPPYTFTSGYAHNFDYQLFIHELRKVSDCPIFISEKEPVFEESVQLNFSGDKGGISGNKKTKNQEWLSVKR